MMLIKNNKLYDVLKWIVMIAIPAFATAYTQLANVLGWGYGQEVAEISVIACTLLGTLLGISNVQYYKANAEKELDAMLVEEAEDEEGNG